MPSPFEVKQVREGAKMSEGATELGRKTAGWEPDGRGVARQLSRARADGTMLPLTRRRGREEAMNALNIRLKRVRSTREAVGLGFFYVGMLAFFIYALVSLVRLGLL